MEYLLAMKRNEVVTHNATIHINYENIMINESQTQRPHTVLFHLYEMNEVNL